MFVPFDNLPSNSRLWIFQAEKKFSTADLTIINSQLQLFTERWAAHGQPLQASFKVVEDRFVLLAVNESHYQASGCSIDDSVKTIKELSTSLGQDLLRRDMVSFKVGDEVVGLKITELKNAFQCGQWNENTLTFNTLVSNKGQLASEWLVPAKSTWLKRYMVSEQMSL